MQSDSGYPQPPQGPPHGATGAPMDPASMQPAEFAAQAPVANPELQFPPATFEAMPPAGLAQPEFASPGAPAAQAPAAPVAHGAPADLRPMTPASALPPLDAGMQPTPAAPAMMPPGSMPPPGGLMHDPAAAAPAPAQFPATYAAAPEMARQPPQQHMQQQPPQQQPPQQHQAPPAFAAPTAAPMQAPVPGAPVPGAQFSPPSAVPGMSPQQAASPQPAFQHAAPAMPQIGQPNGPGDVASNGNGSKGGLQPPPVMRGTSAMQLQGKRLRIGEVLIDMGLIDHGQLERALAVQRETGQRLGKVLINEGLVSSVDIAKALAKRLNVEYINLEEMQIAPDVLSLVPYQTCTRYDAIPIGIDGNVILMAMADPTNVFAIDDIRLITGKDIRVVVASPEAIDICIAHLINLDDSVSSAASGADEWKEDLVPLEDIKDSDADAPAIKLVNQIITQAVITGASDLHFEPQAEDMVVRFRKDGVLSHITTVPNKLRAGVTSRLKIMASLDISERRIPQDGRVGLLVGDKPIDLRVASLPTVYGEKMVLRVLDRSNVLLGMDDMGFLPTQLQKFRHAYEQPYGCVLVTGPTGSGKSTTLYAALNEVNDIAKNIITVEDPVEYRLSGINQVQVNNKAGMTFAKALRSILRCDPDIVMIGEMRDLETASIGIEAALTGHLVLSTLHTNTAPGAVTRLTEMGVEPFLVSSSVLAVLAQRLARRLCKCKEEFQATRDYLVATGWPAHIVEAETLPLLYKPGSCHRCGGSGYKGRLGLHEVMEMSQEIEHLTIERASSEEISRVAVQQGMLTLFDDGVQKILRGDTTMEELQRIVAT